MYTLYNDINKNYLTHPSVGLWYAETKEEALEMLECCKAYLIESGLEEFVSHISIATISSEKLDK